MRTRNHWDHRRTLYQCANHSLYLWPKYFNFAIKHISLERGSKSLHLVVLLSQLPNGVCSQHQLVVMDPDDWRSIRNLSLFVKLLIQLPQGVHRGVGEQLVHLGVGLQEDDESL